VSYQIEAASININLHPKSKIKNTYNISYQIDIASINDNLQAKSKIKIHII
jgi:hypothetical protein